MSFEFVIPSGGSAATGVEGPAFPPAAAPFRFVIPTGARRSRAQRRDLHFPLRQLPLDLSSRPERGAAERSGGTCISPCGSSSRFVIPARARRSRAQRRDLHFPLRQLPFALSSRPERGAAERSGGTCISQALPAHFTQPCERNHTGYAHASAS